MYKLNKKQFTLSNTPHTQPMQIIHTTQPAYYTELVFESYNSNIGIEYGYLILKHQGYQDNYILEFTKQNIIISSWYDNGKIFHVLLSTQPETDKSPTDTFTIFNIEICQTIANYYVIKINKSGTTQQHNNEIYVVQQLKFNPETVFSC